MTVNAIPVARVTSLADICFERSASVSCAISMGLAVAVLLLGLARGSRREKMRGFQRCPRVCWSPMVLPLPVALA